MDADVARDFIRNHHRAVMITRRSDDGLQASPITVGVDHDGMVVVSTRETAMKTKNLRRDPRVSVCVMNDGFFGEWVQVDGEATIVALPEAMEPLVEYYRSIAGEHSDWDDYRAAMQRERRVLVRIAITRVGPDRHG